MAARKDIDLQTKGYIVHDYVIVSRSVRKTARKFHVSIATVSRILTEFNVSANRNVEIPCRRCGVLFQPPLTARGTIRREICSRCWNELSEDYNELDHRMARAEDNTTAEDKAKQDARNARRRERYQANRRKAAARFIALQEASAKRLRQERGLADPPNN